MPPFRSGLHKRKADNEKDKAPSDKPDEHLGDELDSEELIQGVLDQDEDATDSEPDETSDAASDHEPEGVLFDNDADSTLGEDENIEPASDVSSEVTDSEADDESGDNDDDDSPNTSDDDSSVDSGAESGPTQTGTSDVSDTEKKPGRQKKQKMKTKQDKPKQSTQSSVDILADTIKKASVTTTQPVAEKDEYESGDTSDEEDRRNTVGAVPMWWYRDYPHVGYDLDARRILRPPQRDQIDQFLKQCSDPEFWRTVRDPSTAQDVVLSAPDLALIRRLRDSHLPDPNHDDYQPWVEWFTREVMATPLRAFPEHKRSFLPSRTEQQQIARIVHALKMGWTKTRKQLAEERRKKREKQFYDLWGSGAADDTRSLQRHIPAPRRALPAHAESYNPPPEYLLDAREMKEWNKLSETPWKRKHAFLPQRHGSLRAVPAYERFVRERFLRCLDLYLAPRAIKMRLTIGPEELVPKLPAPRELQPFPTGEALRLRGHTALVRSADFDPSGQYAVSGGDDHTVRVWEVSTGRCLRSVALGEAVARVAWIPAGGLSLVAAAAGRRLLLLNPGRAVAAHAVADRTDELLREAPHAAQPVDERTSSAVKWDELTPDEWERGLRIAVTHFKPLTHLSWHARGDYLCVTVREGASRAVLVHQLSRRRSQLPFTRARGLVQCALFHPTRPLLFVATQRAVRVYDLVRQELVRKLLTGAQWISNMAVHPAGDNLLVTSYDRKCIWFDLELSSQPYQTLRLHGGAVRAAAFHRRYPLFATGGDDANIVVSHGMVYNDLLQNPLLVPLKQLRGGEREQLCVLELRFHPVQPWLLAACADGTLRLYT